MQIIFESKEEIQKLLDALKDPRPAALHITAKATERGKMRASDYDARLLGAVFSRVRSGVLTMEDAVEIAAIEEAEAEPLYKLWELLEGRQER